MGKQEQHSVSVIIPTWNGAKLVERVLEGLAAQEGASFELLVVDNGVVNRETEIVCERFQARIPNLKYLRFERQLGYAGAVNEGVAAASHDLVAVINNDNFPEPDWLAALLARHVEIRAQGREAIVSSLVERPDFPNPLEARVNIWGRIVRERRSGPYIPFHPDGSAFLFSRSVFGRPYDPDYFIYHEDVAIGWRAWLSGHEVALAANSRAVTFDGGSTRRIRYATAYYTERNRLLNYATMLSLKSFFCLLPLLWIDAFLKLLAGSNRRAKLHAWSWFLVHPMELRKKRRAIQAQRVRMDGEILYHFSFTYADAGWAARVLNPLFHFYARSVGLENAESVRA